MHSPSPSPPPQSVSQPPNLRPPAAPQGPTKAHPFGYSRDQFVWPLISAVGIFCCGAGVSFIHGVQGLFGPHEVGPLFWNFVVLGVSFVLESHSLRVAIRTLTKRAERQVGGRLAAGGWMLLWEEGGS
jgi:hypothetical protein